MINSIKFWDKEDFKVKTVIETGLKITTKWIQYLVKHHNLNNIYWRNIYLRQML